MNSELNPQPQKDKGLIIKRTNQVVPWITLILGLLYGISPVDIIPDIPVVGWMDDLFVILTAVLFFWEKELGDTHQTLRHILKVSRQLTMLLGAIIILLILVLGFLIFNLF